MGLQNRVTPDARIVSQSWRGTFMGNRGGRIHDPETRTLLRRKWASKRWICCVLSFQDRKRTVMGNSYTELFFLDEVSALAAGHRPCFECRRNDANRFAQIWETAFGHIQGSRADAIDRVLHAERIATPQKLDRGTTEKLPDGCMIRVEDEMLAKKEDKWLVWSGEGYQAPRDIAGMAELLTPPSIVALLRHGYRPAWHRSAG